MDYQIRPARPDDVRLLHDLIRALAEYERLGHEAQATAVDLERHLFGAEPVAEALIAETRGAEARGAEADGAGIGFALYFRSFSTFVGKPGLYLEDLFVHEAFRGHGIGRALLQRLARIAVERGYGRVEWQVLDWNRPAIDFYESIGARGLAEWQPYRLTGDALVHFAADKRNSDG